MESLLGAFAPNIILILRSGMKKVIKRIFLGVFALMIFALGAGIIPSYYFLEVSDYEFENEKIQESVKLVQLSDIHNAEFGKENQRLLIIPGLSEPPVRTLRATIPENESHIFR
jgi:hypothetical protein